MFEKKPGRYPRKGLLLLPLMLLLSSGLAFAQTSTFTYQGRLLDGGMPANGNYDLQFALWDNAAAGTQIGSTQTVNSVSVSGGIFTVTLDFGANAFPGANRFLEISVRPAGGGSFTTLSPRQQISSTPYAVRSLGSTSADTLSSACVGCVTVANGGTGATSFTANAPLIGNGSGAVAVGSRSGSTTTFATTNGALTGSHCVQIDSSGNLVDSGAACGGGGGGGLPDPGSNGYVVRTALNTTAARTLTGTTNQVNITNGDGTGGNSVFSTPQDIATSSNVRFGNLGLNVASSTSGGQIATTLGANNVTGLFIKRNTDSSPTGKFLDFQNAAGSSLASIDITGALTLGSALSVGNGGTGTASFTSNAPLIGNGSGAVSVGSRSGNTTTFATTNGALTGSHCVQIDSSGNLVDSGAGCGGGAGGLPDPGSNGILVRTATNTTTARSLAANSPLAITNADGTTGNPTVSLTGVVPVANGGTGLSSSGSNGNFLKSNGSAWTSTALSAADLPSGSGNYIQNNPISQQAGASFNISGNGTAGGTLAANIVNTTTQYNLGGSRFASASSLNTFVGLSAGNTGDANTFVGNFAGGGNTTGNTNSFFGSSAGLNNSMGIENTFIGANSGSINRTGSQNTLIGKDANVFFGNLTNATAIGAFARVDASNSLVLGSIMGLPGGVDTNVGIGVTAPAARLHIAVNGGNIMFGNAGCNSPFTGIGFGTSLSGCANYSLLGNGTDTIINRPSGGSIFFRENNNDQVRINAGGNVGIGTSAPNAKLQVNSGDVFVQTQGSGIILRATDGANCYRVTVNNAGTLATTVIACP